MLHEDRETWAWEAEPLADGLPDCDAGAAATWCTIRIWAGGRNLLRHRRAGSTEPQEAIHWPAIYLGRWLLVAWEGLWERRHWPPPVPRENDLRPLEILDRLDTTIGLLDPLDEKADTLAEVRDAWVFSHILSTAAAGGWLPLVGLVRRGRWLDVQWRQVGPDRELLNGPEGLVRVPTRAFAEASRSFLAWLASLAGDADPDFRAEVGRWLGRREGEPGG